MLPRKPVCISAGFDVWGMGSRTSVVILVRSSMGIGYVFVSVNPAGHDLWRVVCFAMFRKEDAVSGCQRTELEEPSAAIMKL